MVSGDDRQGSPVGSPVLVASAGLQSQEKDRRVEPSVLPDPVDKVEEAKAPLRGGIDFNTKWLDLRVTSNGKSELFLGNQNIESISIRGIMPRILEIRPVNMDTIFLLIKNSDGTDPIKLVSRDPLNSNRFKGGLYHASVC